MASKTFHHSPATAAIVLFVVLAFGFYNWVHPIQKQQGHVEGKLTDWRITATPGTYSATIAFRLRGYNEEFHIDPNIVHDLMGIRIPAGFRKGASIVVIADKAQLASPIHPLLHPHLGIVWVHGLMVNGVRVLALRDVLRHQHQDWTIWFLAAAAAAGYLGYALWDWNKRRTAPDATG